MEKHYNVQIYVQEIIPAGVLTDPKGYPVKGAMGAVEKTEKRVLSLLELKISAATQAEAYDRAMRILETNRPQEAKKAEAYDRLVQLNDPYDITPEPLEIVHRHRASCDDSGGNLVCGFPPGPSIAERTMREELPRPRSGRPIRDNPQA